MSFKWKKSAVISQSFILFPFFSVFMEKSQRMQDSGFFHPSKLAKLYQNIVFGWKKDVQCTNHERFYTMGPIIYFIGGWSLSRHKRRFCIYGKFPGRNFSVKDLASKLRREDLYLLIFSFRLMYALKQSNSIKEMFH